MDAALAAGIIVSGFCPRGRLAEDGRIDTKYPLKEIHSKSYSKRTKRNVARADVVLIFFTKKPDAGTLLTLRIAEKLCKPTKTIFLDKEESALEELSGFLNSTYSRILIAGPRESNEPGIYNKAFPLLTQFFNALTKRSRP
jgi:hypothetical protein